MTASRQALRALRASALASALACAPSVTFAAPPKTTKPAEATKPAEKRDNPDAIFEESVAAYRAGDFPKAAELLQRAYALKPAPVLLYNLARAYEGMGKDADAVKTYRAYLKDEPGTPDRGAIEAKVATLEARLAEQERQRREAEERANKRDEPPPPPSKPSVLPWIVVGAGGVAAAGSVVLFVLASAKDSEAETERVQLAAEAAADDARAFGTVGLVTAIVGGALVAGGIAWWAVGSSKSSDKPRAIASPFRIRF